MILTLNKMDLILEIQNTFNLIEIATVDVENIVRELVDQLYGLETNDYECSYERRRRYDEGSINLEKLEIKWCQASKVLSDGEEILEFVVPKYSNSEVDYKIRLYRRILKSEKIDKFIALLTKIMVRNIEKTEGKKWNNFVCSRFHLIGYFPCPKLHSKATPNIVHQDNVGWTCIFLLERLNIEGGTNLFFPTSATGKKYDEVRGHEIIAIDMHNVLDAVVWDDRKLSHHVTPMSREKPGWAGSRVILIIDVWQCDLLSS
jgi:hypothetical protein